MCQSIPTSKKPTPIYLGIHIVGVSLIYVFGIIFPFFIPMNCKIYAYTVTIASITFLVAFHLLFGMYFWALAQAVRTEPGKVPVSWVSLSLKKGFYLEDPNNTKRRYCLTCHIFKPERCHHCSTCNKCILNMDHHCPWINNCVGFYNRKFFMLMLIYALSSIFVFVVGSILASIPYFMKRRKHLHNFSKEYLFLISLCIANLMSIVLLIALGKFFQFHLTMVLKNSSTIENLDNKRHSGEPVENVKWQ